MGKYIKLIIPVIFLVFLIAFLGIKKNATKINISQNTTSAEIKNKEPRVISTNPELKDNPTLLPTQTIEITFNIPLENVGEFKNRIDDFKDYKIELSNDRKTAKIIPTKPFELGKSFTIFILPDSKFDGKKKLNQGEHFNFRTIDYHGV